MDSAEFHRETTHENGENRMHELMLWSLTLSIPGIPWMLWQQFKDDNYVTRRTAQMEGEEVNDGPR